MCAAPLTQKRITCCLKPTRFDHASEVTENSLLRCVSHREGAKPSRPGPKVDYGCGCGVAPTLGQEAVSGVEHASTLPLSVSMLKNCTFSAGAAKLLL
jgi:hypothetical protein